MLEAKLPPPSPAVAATSSISQNGVSGWVTKYASSDRRDEQQRRADDRPVAAAERRHREGVGKAHQRADQPGQRHELEQLVGRVVEAGLRQLGRDDAPDQPDRKAEMLGDDRPDQIAAGDRLPWFPERLVLGAPIALSSSCAGSRIESVPVPRHDPVAVSGSARVRDAQTAASPVPARFSAASACRVARDGGGLTAL